MEKNADMKEKKPNQPHWLDWIDTDPMGRSIKISFGII